MRRLGVPVIFQKFIIWKVIMLWMKWHMEITARMISGGLRSFPSQKCCIPSVGLWRRYYFPIEGIWKGSPFLLKMVHERVRGWTSGESTDSDYKGLGQGKGKVCTQANAVRTTELTVSFSVQYKARRSQSIEIDIRNQLIHLISISDWYQLISIIDNNQTH